MLEIEKSLLQSMIFYFKKYQTFHSVTSTTFKKLQDGIYIKISNTLKKKMNVVCVFLYFLLLYFYVKNTFRSCSSWKKISQYSFKIIIKKKWGKWRRKAVLKKAFKSETVECRNIIATDFKEAFSRDYPTMKVCFELFGTIFPSRRFR